jgi:hypothetical protein
VDLYIHSPIRLHGVVLKFVEHRDNFTLDDSEFILVSERNNACLKKLSQVLSSFLPDMCLLKHVPTVRSNFQ